MMVAQTGPIDDEGYRLKEGKSKDKKYMKFEQQIEYYDDENKDLVNSWPSYLIYFHFNMSEYFADGVLIIKYVN